MKKEKRQLGDRVNLEVGWTMQNLRFACHEERILLIEITAPESFRSEYAWGHARDERGIPAGYRFPLIILNRNLPPMEKARAGLQCLDRYWAEKWNHENHAKNVAAINEAHAKIKAQTPAQPARKRRATK